EQQQPAHLDVHRVAKIQGGESVGLEEGEESEHCRGGEHPPEWRPPSSWHCFTTIWAVEAFVKGPVRLLLRGIPYLVTSKISTRTVQEQLVTPKRLLVPGNLEL